jgi:hypothetical protein
VFYAFLRDERAAYDVDSIAQYLREAREGKCRIYTSTMVLAEVLPSHISKQGVGSFQDFLNDLQGAVVLTSPSPDIMYMAARLRDLPYKKGNSPGRRLSTPDAIMLATCVDVRDVQGVPIDFFHTYDDGKKRDPVNGKMVPLISYEDWCEDFSPEQIAVADPVLRLNRRKPIHPAPSLPGVAR